MSDSFEWPDQQTLADEQSFRLWLIKALQQIHQTSAQTAHLQRVANGRVATLETATKALPTMELRVTLVERIVFGASSLMLLGLLGAIVRLAVRA